MTAKQLAQRMGVDIRQLDFELDSMCKYCRKTGGTEEPCEKDCVVIALATIKEEQA